jgi:hypothetical protein
VNNLESKEMDDKDGWWQSMLDLQTDISKRYAAEVTKLRKENADLRRQLAEYPSHATAMQDRVTMLEGLCRRNPAPYAAQAINPSPSTTVAIRS